jgi:peptidoglycan/LPS O-acetylase OafA/YrhL
MRNLPHPRDLSGRIPELDGLRGIAISMVLVFHYFQQPWLTHPGSILAYLQAAARLTWSGVDLFFVLSGFLIGGILLNARKSVNYFQVFYARRFFRIVPIYATVLFVVKAAAFAGPGMHRGDFSWLGGNSAPWYSYWTFTQNFWMAWTGSLGANVLAITWSLAVEEQFYLTLPLVVRFFSGRALLACVLAGICVAPIARTTIRLVWPDSEIAALVLTPCRGDTLLLGVLAAMLLRDDEWKARIQRSKFYFAIAFPVLLLGAAYLTWRLPVLNSPFMASAKYTWMALLYVSFLVYSLTRPKSVPSSVLRFKWLGWLGSIAYGTYLLHQGIQGLVFGCVWKHSPEITGGYTALTTVAALVLTLVVARLSWRYFELPLLRTGHRWKYEFAGQGTKESPKSAPGLVCT